MKDIEIDYKFSEVNPNKILNVIRSRFDKNVQIFDFRTPNQFGPISTRKL